MAKNNTVAIIGGGAAGMFAAIHASIAGAEVLLFEKNPMLGKKLRITGKGRCNVTNNCTPDEFLRNVTRNHKFLYGAINRFSPADAIRFFESIGARLKTERGRRVFPESDRAADIANALAGEVKRRGCTIINERVIRILYDEGTVVGINTDKGLYDCGAAIICTGGLSYPKTGSTGDGYRFARDAGIGVTKLRPSLVPIITEEDTSHFMGLSLKNVVLKAIHKESGKIIFSEMGELLFTHFGLSGPLTLSVSAHMQDYDPGDILLKIDLKPALDKDELDARLLSDFKKYSARDFVNSLNDLLPLKLIDTLISVSDIPPRLKTGEITKEMRLRLLSNMKGLEFNPKAYRPIDEAIITCGGVEVSELNPKTMMSKKVKGLFFAGEIIDVDAYTGGYNLQIAYSTGVIAGQGAAQYVSGSV